VVTEKIDPSRYVYVPGVTKVRNIDLDKVVIRNRATGKRVTEAEREAEGRELDRQRGLLPGGKSLSGDGSHSPVLRVVVSRDVEAAIRANASAEHMSVSKYLRRLIEHAVAS
jgi:hypothetical protein